jgi:hypothetical protein
MAGRTIALTRPFGTEFENAQLWCINSGTQTSIEYQWTQLWEWTTVWASKQFECIGANIAFNVSYGRRQLG